MEVLTHITTSKPAPEGSPGYIWKIEEINYE